MALLSEDFIVTTAKEDNTIVTSIKTFETIPNTEIGSTRTLH